VPDLIEYSILINIPTVGFDYCRVPMEIKTWGAEIIRVI